MMGKMNGLSLDLIVHPGETIKEVIEDRNMTQEELAIRTGYSAKHVSEVISGKKSISSRFANSLEYALNIPMEFWINLQGIYDKEVCELENINNISSIELEISNDLKDIVKYCEKNNILPCSSNKQITVLNLRKFLNVTDLNKIPSLPFQQMAFRGSKKNKVNIYVLHAWKKICEHLTEKVSVVNSFDKEKLKLKYDDIKKTMFLPIDQMVEKLKEIFLDCGIVFEMVKHFTGAPVQGFIQKKDDKVILCMTIRQSFSDIFWFTLFHEIAHLVNEDFINQYVDYNFVESEVEKKADNFARNILINENDYKDFLQKGNIKYIDIKNFASSQNVLPGIVIGRLQNDMKDYTFLTKYKEQYKWNY